MVEKVDTADRRIARIAGRQHGVATSAQLVGVGLSYAAIGKRARSGRLHRIHRGVYAVGHRGLNLRGYWMAAVLACGEGAVLSHTSAVVLLGLLKPIRGPIHVTSPSSNGRARRDGIVLHRSRSLIGAVTMRHRIPVTIARRTIEDLRGCVPGYLLRRAIRQAEMGGFDVDASETRNTRSDLELDFLAFCARHAFPPPEVNVKVGRWEVDFLWPEQMVAVETDFFGYHRGSIAFEDDHQRELDLRRRGFTVRRFTGAQIRNHPAEVVADLGEALGDRASPSRSRDLPARPAS